jgi:hypothetical protein
MTIRRYGHVSSYVISVYFHVSSYVISVYFQNTCDIPNEDGMKFALRWLEMGECKKPPSKGTAKAQT